MALAIIIAIILMKFKPAYAVSLNGEQIGYVESEKDFKEEVNENILKVSEENVAFVALDEVNYSFEFVNRKQVNDETVYSKLEENAKNIYRVYEVADLNNEQDKVYVNTLEEAEELVNTLKSKYSSVEPDLAINPIYLDSVSEISEESIKVAKEKINNDLSAKVEEKSRTVNGVHLACVPVRGTITSRFGAKESIRDHVHQGIDISASNGTTIKAAADGTIQSAGWNDGGYGNLVIINHGNGIQTYYGHCSKIYVSSGQKIKAGEAIAAVGSTGNSTGNHLHFELRQNGRQLNPQKYVYK